MKDEYDKRQVDLERIVAQLVEHHESVLILCTSRAEDGTGNSALHICQRGNVYAHEGAVREWLRKQEAYQHAYFGEQGRRDAAD